MGISSAPVVQRARVDVALDVASGALVGERVAERPERWAIAVAERTLSALVPMFGTCLIVAGGEPASESIGCYGWSRCDRYHEVSILITIAEARG